MCCGGCGVHCCSVGGVFGGWFGNQRGGFAGRGSLPGVALVSVHLIFTRRRKACNLRSMSLHCVQSDQSVSKRAQHAEKLNIPSQRQTGKVYLEERCITLAIGR